MFELMAVVFIIGYISIVFEVKMDVNKSAIALAMGALTWGIYALGGESILSAGYSHSWNEFKETLTAAPSPEVIRHFIVHDQMLERLADVASIIFFLLGAMTIVEVIDNYQGFMVITSRIKTNNRVKLLWLIGILTFFMSSVLDNLTTTIVLVSLMRKLLSKQHVKWIFCGIIVIAANAGGAWSPIGDITTIMLWIGGQATTPILIKSVLVPSLVNMIIPLVLCSFTVKGTVEEPSLAAEETKKFTTTKERNFIFFLGVACLLFVPIFKTVTHLPPFMGMLLGLAVMWIVTEVILHNKSDEDRRRLNVTNIIKKLDTPTILFFTGILLAVNALASAGQLDMLATMLNEQVGNIYGIDMAIGFLSSVVDNSSLVAAAMGMYHISAPGTTGYLADFVADGNFWTFLAYTAGTGGSMLIVGSAAGVAAMGIEKIPFGWYMKHISWMAVIGYLAGAAVYYVLV